jgi:hypothetical protein
MHETSSAAQGYAPSGKAEYDDVTSSTLLLFYSSYISLDILNGYLPS